MRKRGNQIQEKHHCTFSMLDMRGKLRQNVRYIYKQETGGFLLPGERAFDSRGFTYKTAGEVLAGKNYPREKPNVLRWRGMRKCLF